MFPKQQKEETGEPSASKYVLTAYYTIYLP
jgi:hypothetical protein